MNSDSKNKFSTSGSEKRDNKLKVQITLDLTYDCSPSRSNKIDLQKLLALELFRLGDSENNKLSFSDVEVLKYSYKINTNPSKWNKKPNPKENKQ